MDASSWQTDPAGRPMGGRRPGNHPAGLRGRVASGCEPPVGVACLPEDGPRQLPDPVSTSSDRPAGTMIDSADGFQVEVLEILENARNYNDWITSLILPHLGEHPVELGSGLGYQTEMLLDAGLQHVTVSELTSEGVAKLRSRFAGDARVECSVIDFTAPHAAEHSAAYAVNVLEHVADDVGALRGAARLVRDGGRIVVLSVPAFPAAMSKFDRELGHYRRYTRETLRAAFLAASLEPEVVRYVNAPGLPVWLVLMRLLGGRPRWARTLALGQARRAGGEGRGGPHRTAVRSVGAWRRARLTARRVALVGRHAPSTESGAPDRVAQLADAPAPAGACRAPSGRAGRPPATRRPARPGGRPPRGTRRR